MLVFWLLIQLPPTPEWLKALRPEAMFRLEWVERHETMADLSGLEIAARAGLFPQLTSEIGAGVEISASGTTSDAPRDRVQLSEGMRNKPIALSQIYLIFSYGERFLWNVLVGKFSSPVLQTPLLWGEDIRPEGLFQSLSWNSHLNKWRFAAYAAQYSVDQVQGSIGIPHRRSWLFQQGALLGLELAPQMGLRFAVNSYYYFDLSERLANLAAVRGNTFLGTVDVDARFRYHYAPVEALVEFTALPLGYLTSLVGAFALNPRTPSNDRMLFIEGRVGNEWKKGQMSVRLTYYYFEPDVSVSIWSDDRLGFANRHGGRGQIAYYPVDFIKLSVSAVYAQALAISPFQRNRREFVGTLEMKF